MTNILFFIPVALFIISLTASLLKRAVALLKSIFSISLGKLILFLTLFLLGYYALSTNINMNSSFNKLLEPLKKEKVNKVYKKYSSKGLEIEFFDEVKKKDYFWN